MSIGAGWLLVASARCAAGVLACAGLGLWAPPAQAAPSAAAAPAAPAGRSASVPGSADQKPLQVELAADALWFAVCVQPGCSARAGKSIELPPEARGAAGAVLEVLELAPERHLAHVLVPLPGAGTAWEALLAAPVQGSEPLLLFAGVTGAVRGEDGQREGDRLWIREGDNKGRRVLLGRVREDVELCGRPTILEPRLLDRELELRPAKVQQLTLEERRGAPVLDARRRERPTSGGNALRALAASSALGNPAFATDGSTATGWSEGRGGDGRGEFVTFRQLSGSKLVALEFSFRPDGDAAPADGAAPRSIWVATRSSVLRVDFPEDGWRQQGAWYRVDLPAPISEDCLAIVLESSYATRPESSVTLAEVRGVSELQGLDPTALVARLSTPGDAGAAVVPALLQLGRAGVDAVVGAFSALDSTGRLRALDVLEGGPCEVVGGAYVELLSDEDARLRRRAEQRLQSCGGAVDEPLRQAFDRSSGEGGVRLAAALSELSPVLAVELLGPRLAAAPREQRAHYRAALLAAAQHPQATPGIRKLLSENTLGTSSDIEVLRSLASCCRNGCPRRPRRSRVPPHRRAASSSATCCSDPRQRSRRATPGRTPSCRARCTTATRTCAWRQPAACPARATSRRSWWQPRATLKCACAKRAWHGWASCVRHWPLRPCASAWVTMLGRWCARLPRGPWRDSVPPPRSMATSRRVSKTPPRSCARPRCERWDNAGLSRSCRRSASVSPMPKSRVVCVPRPLRLSPSSAIAGLWMPSRGARANCSASSTRAKRRSWGRPRSRRSDGSIPPISSSGSSHWLAFTTDPL